MRSDPEQITHVALKLQNGRVFKLPKPARHGDVISYMATMSNRGAIALATQGFVTAGGEFLNRREAMAVASINGQLKKGQEGKPELYSEDLW